MENDEFISPEKYLTSLLLLHIILVNRFTMCGKETLFIQMCFAMYTSTHCLCKYASQCAAKEHCLTTAFGRSEGCCYIQKREIFMIERGLYYANSDFSDMIRSLGGQWEDTKHRPIVCLIKSSEHDDLYWAIPMGKWSHRSEEQQKRIQGYLDLPDKNIESCYYHLGRTTSKSIFFISDAIPITDKYIESAHVGADNKHFIIKNPNLIAELERKLFRILAYDNSRKGFFRQKIAKIKEHLIAELDANESEQQ